MEEREKLFRAIKRRFREADEEAMEGGRMPMRSTAVGFWGTSNVQDVYDFFVQMDFPEDARFLDLGCGDGRVVMVASLFVQAEGVEYDEELVQTGQRTAEELGLDCSIRCGDILEEDLSVYDILYMYADRNFSYLVPKLKDEMRGTLYLYHDTYHPEGLVKGRTTWVGQIPVFSYRAPDDLITM